MRRRHRLHLRRLWLWIRSRGWTPRLHLPPPPLPLRPRPHHHPRWRRPPRHRWVQRRPISLAGARRGKRGRTYSVCGRFGLGGLWRLRLFGPIGRLGRALRRRRLGRLGAGRGSYRQISIAARTTPILDRTLGGGTYWRTWRRPSWRRRRRPPRGRRCRRYTRSWHSRRCR